jgi:hypothetical protein
VRQALVADKESPYAGLDLDPGKVPEPPEMPPGMGGALRLSRIIFYAASASVSER